MPIVAVKKQTESGEVTLANYDFDAAFEKCSVETRKAVFQDAALISLRSNLFAAHKAGKSAAELQASADAWLPGTVTRVRKDKKEAVVETYRNMSPEDRKEMIKMLRAEDEARKAAAQQG